MIQEFDIKTRDFSTELPCIVRRLTATAESLRELEKDTDHGLTLGVLDGHGLNIQSVADDLSVINQALYGKPK